MAIQSMTLDPNAQSYSDNEIVGKVNTASTQITRANSVADAARPIGDGEVASAKIAAGAIKAKLTAETDGNKLTTSELAAAAGITNAQVATGQAKANLDAMADTARGYIKTSPTSGQFKVIAIERQADGKAKLEYDDVPV
jgi:regulator of protease activity HflC (stomatin/prohibitin superfamily)